jgi:hypothetical protein
MLRPGQPFIAAPCRYSAFDIERSSRVTRGRTIHRNVTYQRRRAAVNGFPTSGAPREPTLVIPWMPNVDASAPRVRNVGDDFFFGALRPRRQNVPLMPKVQREP